MPNLFDIIHISIEALLTVIIPLAVWIVRCASTRMVRVADERAAKVMRVVEAHERKDDERFDTIERERDKQHADNRSALQGIRTDLAMLNVTIKPLVSLYDSWLRSKMSKDMGRE